MDINSLVFFFKVAETKSFTKASKILDIPVSNVSRKINKLESDIGVKLLNRTTRNISLTQDGINLYEKSKPHFEVLENIKSEFIQDDSLVSGLIRLTAPFEEKIYVANLISTFKNSYPNVEFFVHFSNDLENLIEKSFDFAFRGGNLKNSNLFYFQTREENLYAYIHKNFYYETITPDLIKDIDCFLMENNYYLETLDGEIIQPKNKIISNSIEFIKQMAERNKSLIYIPEHFSNDNFVKIPFIKEKSTTFQIVYTSKKQNNICKLFLLHVKNSLGK